MYGYIFSITGANWATEKLSAVSFMNFCKRGLLWVQLVLFLSRACKELKQIDIKRNSVFIFIIFLLFFNNFEFILKMTKNEYKSIFYLYLLGLDSLAFSEYNQIR